MAEDMGEGRVREAGGGLSRRQEALLRRLRDRKARRKEGRVLCEGVRVGQEVLEARPGVAQVEFAAVSPGLERSPRGLELLHGLQDTHVPVIHLSEAQLREHSDTENPQGLLLVVKEPEWRLDDVLAKEVDPVRLLLLDGIQDPGNAGTLIRTALAFGLSGVVSLEGGVDPWNPKTVRAAAGASFHLPVIRSATASALAALANQGIPLLATTLDGTAPWEMERGSTSWCLALGSEGHGVGPEVLAAAVHRVTLPMPGAAESLNVALAGGILLHELTRRDRGAL
ncbi:MAG: RNA methyltransferase [Gemmatimonadota bacterium]